MYSINPNRETFEEFVIRSKKNLTKQFIHKTTHTTTTIFGQRSEIVSKYDDSVLKKWMVQVDALSKIFNISLSSDYKELLCFYCEVINIYHHSQSNIYNGYQGIYSSQITNSNFNIHSELREIYNNIISKNDRAKIVDKYYNFKTGLVEYLLDNGEYVPADGSKKTFEVDYSVFPPGFILLVDSSEYRNNKIDQITNG